MFILMTNVSLKEHIESRLQALEKATEEAKKTLEKRLEGMNEFRSQLKDQAGTFITRVEFEAFKEAMNSRFIYVIISGLGFAIAAVTTMILLHQFLK